MAFDLGKIISEQLTRIPWPIIVAFIAMGGWVWYANTARKTEVAAATAAGQGKVDGVLETIADDKNVKIESLRSDLCGCRVDLARCEATAAAKPAPPKLIVRRVPIEPEPEECPK
jgi:hypothetical protein